MADGIGMSGWRAARAGLALAALVLLAGCEDPTLSAGITIGAGGVAVTPRVSGTVGGLGIGYTPPPIR